MGGGTPHVFSYVLEIKRLRENAWNSSGAESRSQKEEVGEAGMSTSGDPGEIRLMLAYLCIATEKEASLERKVEILERFGLTNSEMAQVCGSAVQSIKNARHYLKSYGHKKSRK